MNIKNRSDKGFTLIELAVSLVVIGLLVGLGTAMVGPLMTAIKVRESKENLGAAVESVNSWASGNNRLPDTTTGATGFKSVVRTPTDAWGRDFINLYDCRFASTDPTACPGAASAITKDTICGRRTTNLKLTDSNTGVNIDNVAYIILSQGDDAMTDSTFSATPAACSPTGTKVVSGSAPAATPVICANTTNDLVRWVTLDELRTKVGCQGAQLRITTNELPFGYNNAAYSANIYADGGVPFSSGGKYSWCIQTSLGDIATPTNITFKSTGGTNIPFKANCSSAVAVKSDYLVIGGTPVIPAVNGTDSKVYSCSQGHVAAAANQPITGANYAQYWQLAVTGTTGSAWASGAAYYPATSNNITVYSYDLDGNSTYKSFVFTVNPQ
jgi:prepilin-type N-terminal cleavage/methylation domain-containing protein